MGPEPPAITPAFGRWIRRLFWAWQAFCILLLLSVVIGLLLSELWPGSNSPWFMIGFYLGVIATPAWLPVTVVLGVLYLLSRPRQVPANKD